MYLLDVTRPSGKVERVGRFSDLAGALEVAAHNLKTFISGGMRGSAVLTDGKTGAVVFEGEADGVSLDAQGVA